MPAKNHLKNEHKNFNVNYEITKKHANKKCEECEKKIMKYIFIFL